MVSSIAAHEDVTTFESSVMPSTSGSMLSLATLTSFTGNELRSVGSLKMETPAKKSNRGLKLMKVHCFDIA